MSQGSKAAVPIRRRVDIDFSDEWLRYWVELSPLKTQVLNAYNIMFPVAETFMVRCVRPYAAQVSDSLLRERIEAFLAQEGQHARLHQRSFGLLEALGYEVAPLARRYERLMAGALEPAMRRFLVPVFGRHLPVALVAGAEHWTAAFAIMNLSLDLGRPSSSPLKKLYYWHGAEEIEHRSVVYDLMRSLRVGYGLRTFGFLLTTAVFLFLSFYGLFTMLGQVERELLFSRKTIFDAVEYLFVKEQALLRWAVAFIQYLRPGFHPDQTPAEDLIVLGLGALDDRRRWRSD